MIKTFIRIDYWVLLLLFCQPQPSLAEKLDDAAAARVIGRLQSAAAQTSSLSSAFVQEKRLSIFDETLLSKGRFIYQAPDHLRWELLTPTASGFILSGQQGERWNALTKEILPFRISSDPLMGIVAQQLFAWAKLDIGWLKSRYRIVLLSEQPVRLQLFPLDRGEAGFIEQLQILFAADCRYVELVEMYEVGGDKTMLRFAKVEVNQPLPADAFLAPKIQ
jgi:outer membrane lipoprotein-sorting protein